MSAAPVMLRRGQGRRTLLVAASASLLAGTELWAQPGRAGVRRSEAMLTVHTFGDSVLDSGRYNDRGVHPGQLLVQNDDALFPEFIGRDLRSRGPVQLDHRAVDGATVDGLPNQARGLRAQTPALALLTIGGNDLLRGLAADTGSGMRVFERKLGAFVEQLPIRPLLVASVYDPTFGDDARNFLGVEATVARANHRRVNAIIAALSQRPGVRFVDLHAHFLQGDPSWFTRTIEPSLRGASEVRRAFLAAF